MGLRNDIYDRFMDIVQGAVPSGITVEPWRGDEAVFNRERSFPAVFGAYSGMAYSPQLEIGQQTFEQDMVFLLWVACVDDQYFEADRDARDLLDYLADALAFTECGDLGQIVPDAALDDGKTEALVEARSGQVLYVQAWRVVNIRG